VQEALDSLAKRGDLWAWGNGNVATTTTPRYLEFFLSNGNPTTVEAEAQFEVLEDGVFRRFGAKHGIAGADATNITYTLRINGANTALAVTIPANSTTGVEITGTVNVSAGDLVSVGVTKAGALPGGGSPREVKAGALFR
jgi:hypothetical protein